MLSKYTFSIHGWESVWGRGPEFYVDFQLCRWWAHIVEGSPVLFNKQISEQVKV